MSTSYKIEVYVDGKWSSNTLRFATKEEAIGNVNDLLSRWFVPDYGRATESNDPVTHTFNLDTMVTSLVTDPDRMTIRVTL